MEKDAEKFMKSIRAAGSSVEADNKIEISFRDGSVVELDPESCRFRLWTAPMLKENTIKTGYISGGSVKYDKK